MPIIEKKQMSIKNIHTKIITKFRKKIFVRLLTILNVQFILRSFTCNIFINIAADKEKMHNPIWFCEFEKK